MSSVINLLRFIDSDYVTDQLTLTQGAIIWGNDSDGEIIPEILEAPNPLAKKFLSISDQGVLTWEDLDTNSTHPVNQDVGTNATKWIIGYTTGSAITESHIIWTSGTTNLIEFKKGDGSAYNNLKIAGLTTSGITSTGAITATSISTSGNASFAGTLNVDGNWNLGTWSGLLPTLGVIESNLISAKSTTFTLNYSNDKRNTDQGGFRYKYDEGGSDYVTWYYSGDIGNVSWVSNKPISLAINQDYRINQTSVLNSTTLGSSVVTSSLTSVGNITTGTWSASPVDPKYGGTGMNAAGSANTIVGMDTAGALMEYKTISGSNGISISFTPNQIVINGSGADTYMVKLRPDSKEGYLFADANDTTNDGVMRIQRASTLSGLTYTYNANTSPKLSWVGLDWNLYNLGQKTYFTDAVPVTLSHVHYALLYSHDDTTQFKIKLEELLAVALDRASTQITPPLRTSDPGIKSSILYDDDYLYICISEDNWKRTPLTTF